MGEILVWRRISSSVWRSHFGCSFTWLNTSVCVTSADSSPTQCMPILASRSWADVIFKWLYLQVPGVSPSQNKSGRVIGETGGRHFSVLKVSGQDEPWSPSLRREPACRAAKAPKDICHLALCCWWRYWTRNHGDWFSVCLLFLFLLFFQQSSYWKCQPVSMVLRKVRNESFLQTHQHELH